MRSSEKTLDQFDLLAQVVKSQLVGAFVSIAPAVVNFTQSIINVIPNIKQYLSSLLEFKEAFIFIAKALLGIKLISFSKSLVVASLVTAQLVTNFTLLGKALKGIGIGLAMGVVVESISLVKQYLDLKKSAQNYIES
ncbi:hypothetical protein CC99x_007780 [Candidatus Berkiella cookevillensis]|uniref:Uncharacterized protein n=1 Tax=Candidatus Berkiella cookevillensis TaxID=437022 RepID=A0AAE3HQG1_9GAMM|nr:hypothetical protein [Candidatus Berkiella cookevillensis]MCS5708802.1 hypothetical protein [Candidatus Berkiella cookevillensis]